jgi:Raf kinase inhibitor-like YbhB/YbcL family protein
MRKVGIIGLTLSMALVAGPIRGAAAQSAPATPSRPAFTLTSPAFNDGGVLPDKYSVLDTGQNISPPLSWVNVPASTESFVLILHDVDVALHSGIDDELHWLPFNIPDAAKGMPEGTPNKPTLPDGTIQSDNGGGLGNPFPGFMAPGAPPGKYHHYVFELYALNAKLNLGPEATRPQILAAMAGHVVGKAALTALFHR